MNAADFAIRTLGPATLPSPLLRGDPEASEHVMVEEGAAVLVDDSLREVRALLAAGRELPCLERAGPRHKLFFRPERVTLGVVTCGGLCPGLNNVLRSLVMTAVHHYGVRRILGFRYGYRGLVDPDGHVELTPQVVAEIHTQGGSILASSRGRQDTGEMLDGLQRLGVDVLFVIGGDGSMHGALDLATEIARRGLAIGVVGIPKTIDNDLCFMDQTFGFQTAMAKAVEAIDCAHREAQGAPNGIGLVKLMGRHSGFIACQATVASGRPNFTLVPEQPFRLEGAGGFLAALQRRLASRGSACVVVAEGAGQDLLAGNGNGTERDASGNVRLKDIGTYLAEKIHAHFAAQDIEINLKYIDPSYIIRSVPANAADAVFCSALGMHAVHAGLCGKTEMLVGVWHRHLVHVPIRQVIASRNVVDLGSTLWRSVLGATGQPPRMT